MSWLTGRSNHEDFYSEECEDATMDLAIALSLTEQESRKGKAIEPCLHQDEDEMLAWALQASLNTESSPERTLVICAGCRTEIDRGLSKNFFGDTWHSECIRCHACNQSISEAEAFVHKDLLYHKSCYDQSCQVCLIHFSSSRSSMKQSWYNPIWNQRICSSHRTDGTPQCCSCGRYEPNGVEYAILNDSRGLCWECLGSTIMDSIECQPLYMDIREFYEGLMMKVEQQIPLLLVERDALNEAREREKNHHHDSLTLGMCLSEEQVIRTVVVRPEIRKGKMIRGLMTKPYSVEHHWHVTAILVLYGLPRIFTGSILAHEMMHAWFRLNGCTGLEPDVEEGICQVMAHMWLESEVMSGSGTGTSTSTGISSSSSSSSSSKRSTRSEFEKKLGRYHLFLIAKNPDRVYGDGFRSATAAVNKYGLRATLAHIKATGALP